MKDWRLRRDQIEEFKIVNGYEDIDRNICSSNLKKAKQSSIS